MRLKVCLVTTVPSPFQVELADAVRSLADDLDYEVLFASAYGDDPGRRWRRGQHWRVDESERPYIHVRGGFIRARDWIRTTLAQVDPDVVICGGYRGEAFRAARSFARQADCRLGFWGEPLFPRPWPVSWARRRVLAHAFRGTDLALCIGDRAYREYSPLVPVGNSFLLPYGQDLTRHFAIERQVSSDPIRFLFSGRLVRQHNLRHLFSALSAAFSERPGAFSVTIAAKGPEQRRLDRVLRANPGLASVVSYDREYTNWEDRIRPFANSDVLLYPSRHAGWGLVVPEAMAAGMLVVASAGVGAARMLVTPGTNGLLIGTHRPSVLAALKWCIDNPSVVRRMGITAREAARRVTAWEVGKTIVSILERSSDDPLLSEPER